MSSLAHRNKRARDGSFGWPDINSAAKYTHTDLNNDNFQNQQLHADTISRSNTWNTCNTLKNNHNCSYTDCRFKVPWHCLLVYYLHLNDCS
jgi:hypothetical protein